MHLDKHQNSYNSETVRLRFLILAFFAPIYLHGKKLALNTTMVTTYAGIYIKRNIIATLLTFSVGELLYVAGYTVLGTAIIGMFVMFAGLCSVYAAAIFEKSRNPG